MRIPISYGEISKFFQEQQTVNPYHLRSETIQQIEQITKRRLLCYVARVDQRYPPHYAPIIAQVVPVNDDDLLTFQDLCERTQDKAVDILVISNGGSAEASERIVNYLRQKFDHIRWVVPFNAYSAATLLCLSGNEIVMGPVGTLGPVDPQIAGIPARTILRAFADVRKRLKREGAAALVAYAPLLEKYNLHLFEICKSALQLSQELVRRWLTEYMFSDESDEERKSKVRECVRFFSSYDIHKSHARSIDRETARQKGIRVVDAEDIHGMPDLLRSLCNQYKWLFDNFPIAKIIEDGHGETSGIFLELLPVSSAAPQSL